MTTHVGPQIAGLTFLRRLGGGGYSDVYLYERRAPRMEVAVKVLSEGRLSPPELAQFEAEAETMAELSGHPNIVQVFYADTTADGRPCLLMMYYPNPNLGERAAAGQLSVSEVLRTGIKIASAVETAHRAQILHRDIKPANILVNEYDEPGLTDFGIAGRAGDTEDSDLLGVSIPWSPPEVLSSESNGTVQSDVYSLGATLWHLLVGRSPFQTPGRRESQDEIVNRVLRSPAPATGRGDVPASLERLLAQAMSKNPSARPRSALEFAQTLQGVEQEQRFPTTKIVLKSVATPNAPVARDPDDGTRLKGPTRVVAQPPSTHLPPTRTPTSAEPPTRGRPVVPTAASTARRARPEADAGSTVQRSRTSASADAESGVPRRGLRPRTVAIAAGAVVGAAVLVGAVVASGGGGKPHETAITPPPADDQTSAPTVVPVPVIRASYDQAQRVAIFTWSVSGVSGGSVVWAPAGQPDQVTRTASRQIRIRTSDPAGTCIQVRYVTAATSQQSEASDPVCAR